MDRERMTVVSAERGSAMTELLILIMPYAMIFIGTMVLTSLALGRQESQKASMLAPYVPEEQEPQADGSASYFLEGKVVSRLSWKQLFPPVQIPVDSGSIPEFGL